MARRLDKFPVASNASNYPWAEWLNGEVWELVRGEDYMAKSHSFLGSARYHAQKLGGRLRSRAFNRDGRETLIIQNVLGR